MVKLGNTYSGASWVDARAKVVSERKCRLCGRSSREVKLEAAHTIGRARQDVVRTTTFTATTGEKPTGSIEQEYFYRYVPPEAVVPLCVPRDPVEGPGCHRLYDEHKVSILEVLTHEEQANAVAAVGIVAALKRLNASRAKYEAQIEEAFKAIAEEF